MRCSGRSDDLSATSLLLPSVFEVVPFLAISGEGLLARGLLPFTGRVWLSNSSSDSLDRFFDSLRGDVRSLSIRSGVQANSPRDLRRSLFVDELASSYPDPDLRLVGEYSRSSPSLRIDRGLSRAPSSDGDDPRTRPSKGRREISLSVFETGLRCELPFLAASVPLPTAKSASSLFADETPAILNPPVEPFSSRGRDEPLIENASKGFFFGSSEPFEWVRGSCSAAGQSSRLSRPFSGIDIRLVSGEFAVGLSGEAGLERSDPEEAYPRSRGMIDVPLTYRIVVCSAGLLHVRCRECELRYSPLGGSKQLLSG